MNRYSSYNHLPWLSHGYPMIKPARSGPWWPPQRLERWRAGLRPPPVKMKAGDLSRMICIVGSISVGI